MSKIVISRCQALWQDRARDYRVLVDGQERARVGNGATVEVAVALGRHVVQMQIDWCKSKPLQLDVKAGEAVQLACGPNASPVSVLLYISLWSASYIWLRPGTGVSA